MRTGFCNRLNDAASHARCPSVNDGKDCECDCHEHHAVIWTDWMGEAQGQQGFDTLADAQLVLDILKRVQAIPEHSETEVFTYRGDMTW